MLSTGKHATSANCKQGKTCNQRQARENMYTGDKHGKTREVPILAGFGFAHHLL